MKQNLAQNHISVLLARAHRQMANLWSTDLKPVGLTLDIWIVLGVLATKPGQSMTNLADELSLNLPTVTKIIDRMVSDNLVYRKSHHRDRRRVLIFPTERGLELFHEASSIAKRLEQNISDKIKQLPELKATLAALIKIEM